MIMAKIRERGNHPNILELKGLVNNIHPLSNILKR